MDALRALGTMLLLCLLAVGCDAATVTPRNGGGDEDMGTHQVRPCTISECRDGIARRCNGGDELDCAASGGQCATFGGGATRYQWCGCSEEGRKTCLDARNYTQCDRGELVVRQCDNGTACDDRNGSPTCTCDNMFDQICPLGCPTDPDCDNCMPSCDGKECGDNGCGSTCGSCTTIETCDANGQCVANCTPSCGSRVCGDDGCGGSCGACGDDEMCSAGACVPRSGDFDPNCNELCAFSNDGECDDGGSGWVSTVCGLGTDCIDCGRRVGVPSCADKNTCDSCLATPGCGYCASRGFCMPGNASGPTDTAGICAQWKGTAPECSASCTPSCAGRVCGDDGCGGSCGTCSGSTTCNSAGMCVGSTSCNTATTCGDCTGRSGCGFCGASDTCMPGTSGGPGVPFFCASDWTTSSATCGGTTDPCATSTTCEDCTARPGCGFCADSSDCASGNSSGPSTGLCALWSWHSIDCIGL